MSHLTIHEIGGFAVSSRMMRAALLALAVAATGAAVFALTHGSVTVPHTPSAALGAAVSAPAYTTITLLPTVVVRADAVPLAARTDLTTTRMPTVRVRAERTLDSALASVDGDDDPALHTLASGPAAGTGYDMPYYSFGKTLRRLNKE